MEKLYPPPVIRSHPTQVINRVSDSTAEPLRCFSLWHLLIVQQTQRCTQNILSEGLTSSYFHIFGQGTNFVSELFCFVVSDKVFGMLHMQATLALFSKQRTVYDVLLQIQDHSSSQFGVQGSFQNVTRFSKDEVMTAGVIKPACSIAGFC